MNEATTTKTRESLENIINLFRDGNIPEAIGKTIFPISNDIPMSKWSLRNRLICTLNHTADARGYKQWKEAGRQVKKGSRAFQIQLPIMRTKKATIDDVISGKASEVGEAIKDLLKFKGVSIFRYEDTEGEELSYMKGINIPNLPLIEKAKEWGIKVDTLPGNHYCLGYYSDKEKEIRLATDSESVFFHELSHAAHYRVLGNEIKKCSKNEKELVAEFCASTLLSMVGVKENVSLANFKYIKNYADLEGLDISEALFSLIDMCDLVLNEILF